MVLKSYNSMINYARDLGAKFYYITTQFEQIESKLDKVYTTEFYFNRFKIDYILTDIANLFIKYECECKAIKFQYKGERDIYIRLFKKLYKKLIIEFLQLKCTLKKPCEEFADHVKRNTLLSERIAHLKYLCKRPRIQTFRRKYYGKYFKEYLGFDHLIVTLSYS